MQLIHHFILTSLKFISQGIKGKKSASIDTEGITMIALIWNLEVFELGE
jgi:hypothetical protein